MTAVFIPHNVVVCELRYSAFRWKLIFAQRPSVAKSVGCFQRRLFVCQHDNFWTSKRSMTKLGGRCIVQKSRPSSNLGVIAPWVRTSPQQIWRFAESTQKVPNAIGSDETSHLTHRAHRTSVRAGVIAPLGQHPQNVALGYDVGKISASCLVLFCLLCVAW